MTHRRTILVSGLVLVALQLGLLHAALLKAKGRPAIVSR